MLFPQAVFCKELPLFSATQLVESKCLEAAGYITNGPTSSHAQPPIAKFR
jgi:hypothetical protein